MLALTKLPLPFVTLTDVTVRWTVFPPEESTLVAV